VRRGPLGIRHFRAAATVDRRIHRAFSDWIRY
jgi:hypothetical protein